MDPVASFRSCEPGIHVYAVLTSQGEYWGPYRICTAATGTSGNRYSADILYKKLRAENGDFRYQSK